VWDKPNPLFSTPHAPVLGDLRRADSRGVSGPLAQTRDLRRQSLLQPRPLSLAGTGDQDQATTCKQGHLLTPDNVVIENRKGRQFKRCRICRCEAWKSKQKQKPSRQANAQGKDPGTPG